MLNPTHYKYYKDYRYYKYSVHLYKHGLNMFELDFNGRQFKSLLKWVCALCCMICGEPLFGGTCVIVFSHAINILHSKTARWIYCCSVPAASEPGTTKRWTMLVTLSRLLIESCWIPMEIPKCFNDDPHVFWWSRWSQAQWASPWKNHCFNKYLELRYDQIGSDRFMAAHGLII